MKIAEVRKAIAAAIAGVTALVAAGVLSGASLNAANVVIAVLGAAAIAIATFATSNDQPSNV